MFNSTAELADESPVAKVTPSKQKQPKNKVMKKIGKVARLKAKHPKAVQALDALKKLRPLQLWLTERPVGTSCQQRLDEWKRMDKAAKQLFAQDTKARRGVAGSEGMGGNSSPP